MYAQKNGLKYRLIKEDIDKMKENRDHYIKNKNREAASAEMVKIKMLKKEHKIRPYVALFNILQFPIHIAAFLLCNEISLN